MNFCPSCGTPVNAPASAPINTPAAEQSVVNTQNALADYRLILLSVGDCTKKNAAEMTEDLFGYSASDAKKLVNAAPVEIACGLTGEQAQYLAQAMTEYGMQVSVYCGENYVSFNDRADKSVFDSSGNLLAGVAGVLATISLANRVNEIRRWTYPDPYRFMFVPRYRRPAPPRHIRRTLFGIPIVPPPPRPPRPHHPPRFAPPPRHPAPPRPPMGGPRPGGPRPGGSHPGGPRPGGMPGHPGMGRGGSGRGGMGGGGRGR